MSDPVLLIGGTAALFDVIDVYVDGGQVRADHAFWVFGLPFLVLHYRIRPKQ